MAGNAVQNTAAMSDNFLRETLPRHFAAISAIDETSVGSQQMRRDTFDRCAYIFWLGMLMVLLYLQNVVALSLCASMLCFSLLPFHFRLVPCLALVGLSLPCCCPKIPNFQRGSCLPCFPPIFAK